MANGDTSSLRTEVKKKSYFFLQKPLKTRVNSKSQSKGSTYILYLLAFVEIRLFNVFFWGKKSRIREIDEKRAGCGILAKKGAGMRVQDPAFGLLLSILNGVLSVHLYQNHT